MKEELTRLIERELSYDATLVYECDRCGNSPKSYWIDHKESLASVIAFYLGLKTTGIILTIIEEASYATDGDRKKDTEYIINRIDDEVMGLPTPKEEGK